MRLYTMGIGGRLSMHKAILVTAFLAILLAATPAVAQSPSSAAPGYASIGGVTEDGFVRAASDVYLQCSPEEASPAFVQQYAVACAEAGFPIFDAQPSDAPVPAGTPTEPAAQTSAGETTSGVGRGGAVLPDTGGPTFSLVAGLLLAGVGLVARRSTR